LHRGTVKSPGGIKLSPEQPRSGPSFRLLKNEKARYCPGGHKDITPNDAFRGKRTMNKLTLAKIS